MRIAEHGRQRDEGRASSVGDAPPGPHARQLFRQCLLLAQRPRALVGDRAQLLAHPLERRPRIPAPLVTLQFRLGRRSQPAVTLGDACGEPIELGLLRVELAPLLADELLQIFVR
ncbi:hypothetical protein DM47_3518 [Burkholderia mallei]|nr:hypothetical protein DM75_3565 [Burkholderia mallei]KOT00679.1 hypothetical protein DM50_2338 [Burkholderia mallei]KOT20056.1 hypothetical protein DM47_3518 [Burkholderia mallei]KOT22872.1 hypothetical protein DM52_2655 [Burkholderia mallei]